MCSATSSNTSEKYPESCLRSHCWKSSCSSAVGRYPCSFGLNVVCKFCHRRYCFRSRGVNIALAGTSLRARMVLELILLRLERFKPLGVVRKFAIQILATELVKDGATWPEIKQRWGWFVGTAFTHNAKIAFLTRALLVKVKGGCAIFCNCSQMILSRELQGRKSGFRSTFPYWGGLRCRNKLCLTRRAQTPWRPLPLIRTMSPNFSVLGRLEYHE